MNPGSPEAVKAGCLCAIGDNANGAGSGYTDKDGKPLFWIEEWCPLHGQKEKAK